MHVQRPTATPPFTTRLLRSSNSDTNAKKTFRGLLPATQRTKDSDIFIPSPDLDFLEADLLVPKLERIQQWLWLCGWLMPPRSLHHQLLLSREVVISEDPNMHLVWHENRIFIKPLPLYLLDPDFWTHHILEGGNNGDDRNTDRDRGSNIDPGLQGNMTSDSSEEGDETIVAETKRREEEARHLKLASCARGLLFSYTALIAYESDFRLAKDRHLIPEDVKWEGWQTLTAEFLQLQNQQQQTRGGGCYAAYHPRYWYGELRLNRLDKVYIFTGTNFLRGYSRVAGHGFYGALLSARFATLATLLGYVLLVLTALQVGLGVERLAGDDRFQRLGFGATLFAMVSPLVAGLAIFVGMLPLIASNLVATRTRERVRFKSMGVEPEWKMGREQNKTMKMGEDGRRGGWRRRLRRRRTSLKGMVGGSSADLFIT